MKKDKTKKHRGIANPRYAREIAELRRSGASGQHLDKRTKRARTRQSSEYRAIQDYSE